jgi:hypothetical protein
MATAMYKTDSDDHIPLSMNGWWDRIQDRKTLTVACPGTGTQSIPAPDAGGAAVTQTWPKLIDSYTSLGFKLYIDPRRGDVMGVWEGPAKFCTDPSYLPGFANTYRNQCFLPMFGLNYIYLSPIEIPSQWLSAAHPMNYAEGAATISDSQIADPAGTVQYCSSKVFLAPPAPPGLHGGIDTYGYFGVNAPGARTVFASTLFATTGGPTVILDGGTRGSGDWLGTKDACQTQPCPVNPDSYVNSQSSAYCGSLAMVIFCDGHVKAMSAGALASGTNYPTASATGTDSRSGCVIVDYDHYLWDLK